MLTVHVQPLTMQGDNKPARVARFVENRFMLPVVTGVGGAEPPPHPVMHRSLVEAAHKNTEQEPYILQVPAEARP